MCLFVLKSIGIIAFSYIFLSLLNRGLTGVFESILLAAVIFAVLTFVCTFRMYGFSFSFKYLSQMLKYGLPLWPAMLFSWVIDFSDRYFVRYFLSLADAGLYSLGYKFGQLVYMAALSFLMCWGPILFTIVKEKKSQGTIAKLSTYIAAGFMFICLAVSLFGREIVMLMAENSYYSSYTIIPLISFSYYLFGIYMLFFSGILVSKQVFKQPIILGMASLANILLNIILIPRMGIMGAAIATVATYFFVAAYTYLLAQRSYPIPYELGRLATITLTGIAIFIFSMLASRASLNYSLFIKLFIFICYPITLFALGIFSKAEFKKFWIRLR